MATPRAPGTRSFLCYQRLCRPPIWDFLLPLVCNVVLFWAKLTIYSACCQACAFSQPILCKVEETCLAARSCVDFLLEVSSPHQHAPGLLVCFVCPTVFLTRLDCSQYFDCPQLHGRSIWSCLLVCTSKTAIKQT